MRLSTVRIACMKAALIIFFAWSATGCAGFPSSDRIVKIQIKGLNYPHAEIVFRVDTPHESDLDIFLTNNYAIRIGLEWLKIQQQDLDMEKIWFDANPSGPLIPWLTCKYYF